VPHTREDHFNMYKSDWKTPFRNSEFNIRPIYRIWDDDELADRIHGNFDELKTLDIENPEHREVFARPNIDEILAYESKENCEDIHSKSIEEQKQELWALFEEIPKQAANAHHQDLPWFDQDDEWNQQ
jgi:hypothetical protein